MLTHSDRDLRTLLAHHADARIMHEQHATPGTTRRLERAAYALCVATGREATGDAVAAARDVLDSAAERHPAGC
ncbi:DUF5133 domain-containing protein [Streptomyces phytohabitans]|uniref:DUF5133 domain-containing protein n=1 Tax=Streptomyces phytohabitans TaxID=1150371 RepID=UPI00345C5AAF